MSKFANLMLYQFHQNTPTPCTSMLNNQALSNNIVETFTFLRFCARYAGGVSVWLVNIQLISCPRGVP